MVRIETYAGEMKNEIAQLADSYEFKPYFYVSAAASEALETIFRNRVAKFLASAREQPDKIVFFLGRDEKSRIKGFAGAEVLEFDSKILGIRSGRVPFCVVGSSARESYPMSRQFADALMGAALGWLRNERVVFTTLRTAAPELPVIHAAEAHGFRLIDNGITALYHKDSFTNYQQEGYDIRLFEYRDLDTILDITRDAFIQDRFHLDPRIPYETAEELKQLWVRRCCTQPRDQEWVLIAERKGLVKGYFQYEYNREFSEATGIGLYDYGPAAVARDRSALGAYYALLSYAVADSIRRGGTYAMTRVPFGIQPILKLTLRLGPAFMTNDLTFHHWRG
jgi:hypothetical protein